MGGRGRLSKSMGTFAFVTFDIDDLHANEISRYRMWKENGGWDTTITSLRV